MEIDVDAIREVASTLRQIPSEKANVVYLENRAGRYIVTAIDHGGFGASRFLSFREDVLNAPRRNGSYLNALLFANEWMLKNGLRLGLQMDSDWSNADLVNWCPFYADLLDGEAEQVELGRTHSLSIGGNGLGTIQLFISHSNKDEPLVAALIDLLQHALRLRSADIRCTSLDGYRLPGGVDTDDQLRKEVGESCAFIGVITDHSSQSMYVAFELGARWAAQRHLVPLLGPSVKPEQLPGPLKGKNALRCDKPAQVQQLVAELADTLNVVPEPPYTYQRYLERLLAVPPA